jgi:putative phosphoesterase
VTRIVVLSDTHGNRIGVEKLLPLIEENHYCVFLGDGARDISPIIGEYPKKIYFCAGNCDFFSELPTEGVLETEQVKIFYTHGHKYGVKSNLYALAQEAKRRGCSVAFYGHTHVARVDEVDGVLLVNPGSLRYDVGKGGSYAYVVVNGEKVTATVVGERYF